MDKSKISGIYSIVNKVNGKRYIGSSKSVYYRWAQGHLPQLRDGNHYNNHLQNAWNKYGDQSFLFEVTEECPETVLLEREGYWIEHYKSWEREHGYNLTRIVDGAQVLLQEAKDKISKSNKIRFDLETYWSTGTNGEILTLFKSGMMKNAIAKTLGITRSAVYSCLEHNGLHEKTGQGAVTKLTNEMKDRISEMRNAGMSWAEISKRTGVSKTQLYRSDTNKRDGKYGGDNNRQTYRTITPEVIEQVSELRDQGKKWDEIEEIVGVSRFALHANGVTKIFKPISKTVKKNKMSTETRKHVLQLLTDGKTVKEISLATDVAQSTIRYQRDKHAYQKNR